MATCMHSVQSDKSPGHLYMSSIQHRASNAALESVVSMQTGSSGMHLLALGQATVQADTRQTLIGTAILFLQSMIQVVQHAAR